MLKDIFHSYKKDRGKKYTPSLGLANSRSDYDVYKSIIEMSEVVGEDAYTVDKVFWLIGSGKFDPDDKNRAVERCRQEFIESMEAKLADKII